jgi:hypothetical protein
MFQKIIAFNLFILDILFYFVENISSMSDKYVFQNFEHGLMTLDGAICYVEKRIATLKNQGFNDWEIEHIIFHDSLFSDCFTDPLYFRKVKKLFYK